MKEKTCALTGHRTVEKDFEVDLLREIFIKLIDINILYPNSCSVVKVNNNANRAFIINWYFLYKNPIF